MLSTNLSGTNYHRARRPSDFGPGGAGRRPSTMDPGGGGGRRQSCDIVAGSRKQSMISNNDSYVPALTLKVPNRAPSPTPSGNSQVPYQRSKTCGYLNYPTGVYFMFGNEFCERFSFYGMRAVLTIYLIMVHQMEAHSAKMLYHLFITICYFSPILGSALADGFLGRYRVILYVSIVYCLGHGFLTLGAIPSLELTALKVFDYIGLFTIALSTGGIKPCVSAFAADQFPDSMKKEREQFFSYFYFTINAGALLSIAITPTLRYRVKCFGLDHCFPLAFGVPAVLMTLATIIFISGRRFYTIVPRSENIIGKVFRCIGYAIKKQAKKTRHYDHWLDHAVDKYGQTLVEDIKGIFRIIILFIPVVFFWALADQQGSTWILQANQMEGRIIWGLTVLPDQMTILNPLLIIILVPVFETLIYPNFRKLGILKTPLQKMGIGGLLCGISFIVVGFIQVGVNETLLKLPQGNCSRFIFVNRGSESVHIHSSAKNFTVKPNNSISADLEADSVQFFHNIGEPMHQVLEPVFPDLNLNSRPFSKTVGNLISFFSEPLPPATTQSPAELYNATFSNGSTLILDPDPVPYKLPLPLALSSAASLSPSKFRLSASFQMFELKKASNGNSQLFVVLDPQIPRKPGILQERSAVLLCDNKGNELQRHSLNGSETHWIQIKPTFFSPESYNVELSAVFLNESSPEGVVSQSFLIGHLKAGMGGVYAMVVPRYPPVPSQMPYAQVQLVEPNSVSLLAQVPAYILMSVGEIMFSIPGLEFSYSQAAPSMKSVLQAIWLLTIAFGNAIDMIIAGSHFIPDQAMEFFFYAGLMVTVMILFIILAVRYKYVDRDAVDYPSRATPSPPPTPTKLIVTPPEVVTPTKGLRPSVPQLSTPPMHQELQPLIGGNNGTASTNLIRQN